MKVRIILITLAATLAAAGGYWWWRAGRQAQIVAAALPPVPDLTDALPVLRQHILAADARARHRLTAVRGLADLGRLYQANGFLAEATRCYEGLERLMPDNPRWYHYEATILGGFGETARAARLWRQVIRLAPDYVPARLRLGDCLLKTDQLEEATVAYEAVLKISPDNPYARLNLARIDMEKKRWDQARPLLEAVVKQTHFALGYDLIVNLYEQIGLHREARAIRGSVKASGAYRDPPDPWLDELMDVCYDPYRLGLVAGVAAQSGDPARAIRLLKRALTLAPGDVSTHFQLGGIAEMQHDLKGAIEEYRSCTVLAPSFADGWAHLSAVEAQVGDRAGAERTLAQGLAHCPDSPGLHLMRARNLRAAGRTAAALAEYKESIRLRPNEPEAYTDLGDLYIETGNANAGIEMMRQALEADPGDPMALGVMAFHAIGADNEAEARQWLDRVINQPRVPRAQVDRLLDAYRQAFGHEWVPDQTPG